MPLDSISKLLDLLDLHKGAARAICAKLSQAAAHYVRLIPWLFDINSYWIWPQSCYESLNCGHVFAVVDSPESTPRAGVVQR
jgi:hypothetical protein